MRLPDTSRVHLLLSTAQMTIAAIWHDVGDQPTWRFTGDTRISFIAALPARIRHQPQPHVRVAIDGVNQVAPVRPANNQLHLILATRQRDREGGL